MELWIRSQDKETLLKISRLYLGYSGLSIESGYCQLGTYKTKNLIKY